MCAHGVTRPVRLCRPMEASGRKIVTVDACLAPLVQALNDVGVRTIGSCCGHGESEGSILIEQRGITCSWMKVEPIVPGA